MLPYIVVLLLCATSVLSAQLYYPDTISQPNTTRDTNSWINLVSNNRNFSFGLATANNGNVLLASSFWGRVEFGGGITLNNNGGSQGGNDIFVANYASDGKLKWILREGGSSIGNITTDNTGNIYLTGSCVTEATFSGVITTHGFQDMFVAKYRPDGQLLWVQRGGGNDWCAGSDIAVDNKNNVLITGWYRTSIFKDGTEKLATFGSLQLRGISTGSSRDFLNKRMLSDGYIAKYAPDGNVVWVHSFGGSGLDGGNGLDVDHHGNIYITGDMTATVTTNTASPLQIDTSTLFLAKYSPEGHLLWQQHFRSNYRSKACDIVLDAQGNPIIVGWFTGTLDLQCRQLSSAGKNDGFIAKFDSTGQCLWGVSVGGSDDDDIQEIAIDSSGKLLVVGSFTASATFADTTAYGYGGTDMFVASYRSDGVFEWIRAPKGVSNEEGKSIAVGSTGDIYAVGEIHGDTWFDGKKAASAKSIRTVVWRLNNYFDRR